MKKNYLVLISFLCSGLISLAQPILTSADLTNFSVAIYNVPEFSGVTPGNAGANQTWDYSSLVTSTDFVFYLATVPVSQVPYANNFPNANYFYKASFIFEEVLYESFSLFQVTASGIETLGQTSSEGIEDEYIDTPFTPLPLNYNDTYIDVEQSTTDTEPSSSNSVYDAYGTLMLPNNNTYTNTIRLKTIRDNATSYNWIKVNPYTPLMNITVSNTTGLVTDVSIYQNSPGLGINQNSSLNKITAYPNPTTNTLNLQLATNTTLDKIVITDLLGKIVLEDTQNPSAINVENLSNGVYILQGYSNGQMMETKFVKQ